jgi:hypothetical protein
VELAWHATIDKRQYRHQMQVLITKLKLNDYSFIAINLFKKLCDAKIHTIIVIK